MVENSSELPLDEQENEEDEGLSELSGFELLAAIVRMTKSNHDEDRLSSLWENMSKLSIVEHVLLCNAWDKIPGMEEEVSRLQERTSKLSYRELVPIWQEVRKIEDQDFRDRGGKCWKCRDSGNSGSKYRTWYCSCPAGQALQVAMRKEWEEEQVAKQREEALRQERERQAFHEAGGQCFACQDTGGSDAYPCRQCDPGRARWEAQQEAGRRAVANTEPFKGRTLDTWLSVSGGPPALTAALRDWEESWPGRKPFLLLHGPTGTGKSSLAAALLDDAMRRTGKGGWRWEVPELIAALRPGPDQDEWHLRRAQRVPLLILDDLGVAKPSEWVQEQLYRIVNERYEGGMWTIVTTNQSPDDCTLVDRLGERIFWRIHEKSLSVEVNHGNLRDR